ncbi:site-specific integrase [Sphaerospermopsis sp. LEGE 08334]|uniref:site-specific integrase n=1 Tax=Sphaerospermopsis sp. LEGE 08334 TaxID=1828651 RepID=UPI001880C04A|nr:site-specific integrase [Sphaerospermopsis sp. LEGE 08334]MBE9056335.1 site-specific integrase [Sphaerospermopsis sp. LEGE 08334]
MSNIEQRIKEANGRLRANYVGFQIEIMGGKLCIRGTMPPRPNSNHTKPYRQRLTVAKANNEGVKIAEKMAKIISVQIDAKTFDWVDYLNLVEPETTKTIGDWVREFEKDYFLRRERTFKTETTWKVEYESIFKFLPHDEHISPIILEKIIIDHSSPDTRIRKRYCQTLSLLAKFAGLNCDFLKLSGNYSNKSRKAREIPTDKQIQDFYFELKNPGWRWVYGMIATYGLRNHEVFFVDLDNLFEGETAISITQGKTGSRKIWPLHPEWVETFNLLNPTIPLINLDRPNREIGFTCTRYFSRVKMPFHVYDLRHAWAVRSLEYGIDISLAAKQMGHSLQVHSNLYHSWIDSKIHQRAFDAALLKDDRPRPPDT